MNEPRELTKLRELYEDKIISKKEYLQILDKLIEKPTPVEIKTLFPLMVEKIKVMRQ